jgi:hypothetical protein
MGRESMSLGQFKTNLVAKAELIKPSDDKKKAVATSMQKYGLDLKPLTTTATKTVLTHIPD